jgi:hypothetical protein
MMSWFAISPSLTWSNTCVAADLASVPPVSDSS